METCNKPVAASQNFLNNKKRLHIVSLKNRYATRTCGKPWKLAVERSIFFRLLSRDWVLASEWLVKHDIQFFGNNVSKPLAYHKNSKVSTLKITSYTTNQSVFWPLYNINEKIRRSLVVRVKDWMRVTQVQIPYWAIPGNQRSEKSWGEREESFVNYQQVCLLRVGVPNKETLTAISFVLSRGSYLFDIFKFHEFFHDLLQFLIT